LLSSSGLSLTSSFRFVPRGWSRPEGRKHQGYRTQQPRVC
jgi:hypothetical protein